jgi:hypothetical protein
LPTARGHRSISPLPLETSALLCLFVGGAAARAETVRTPGFDERVRAQEAIERVYFAHQLGVTRSF